MLTEREVVAIYEIKIQLKHRIMAEFSSPRNFSSLWGKTGPISKRYGVSSRTVKYIWNRQTWAHVTNHLWPDEPEIENLKKGSKLPEHARLPENINCSSHSETSSQPKAWTAEKIPGACPVHPRSTAVSLVEPTPSSIDDVIRIISGTEHSVSGVAAPWIPPFTDRPFRGRPESPHQCADPPQIAKAKSAPDSCINTYLLASTNRHVPSSTPAIAATATLDAGPAPEDPPPPWLDSALAMLGADPFHADWPHW